MKNVGDHAVMLLGRPRGWGRTRRSFLALIRNLPTRRVCTQLVVGVDLVHLERRTDEQFGLGCMATVELRPTALQSGQVQWWCGHRRQLFGLLNDCAHIYDTSGKGQSLSGKLLAGTGPHGGESPKRMLQLSYLLLSVVTRA